ncbi:HORMA domain protein [Aspergillus luchuensis]|uniref:HORMA domain protein n=1 Tax=Aspergillus kawachii TaxID=1069201 RepID=A0A146FES4_ASPKA|nr:HORMA domain protein [Aspergillus luchuensis]
MSPSVDHPGAISSSPHPPTDFGSVEKYGLVEGGQRERRNVPLDNSPDRCATVASNLRQFHRTNVSAQRNV